MIQTCHNPSCLLRLSTFNQWGLDLACKVDAQRCSKPSNVTTRSICVQVLVSYPGAAMRDSGMHDIPQEPFSYVSKIVRDSHLNDDLLPASSRLTASFSASSSFPSSLNYSYEFLDYSKDCKVTTLKAAGCTHYSLFRGQSFWLPGLSPQGQIVTNATIQTKSRLATHYLATRKPKSVSAVRSATSVSVMGSASRAAIYHSMIHLTLRAPARTIPGILLRSALKFATTIKPGK